MVCTARARSQLYEVDSKWMLKFRLRIAHNIFCVASVGAAAIVLSRPSNYQPNSWKYSRAVLYYIPFVIVTFIWNIANIIFLVKQARPLKNAVNAVVHFILAAAFIVVGSIATAYCVQGYKNTGVDPYGIKVGTGVHDIKAMNGSIITVSAQNAHSCPAFPSCELQKKWTMGAGKRAVIAIIGCALFGMAFIFNVVFFVFGCNDAVYGTSPATMKLDDEKSKDWKKGKRMTLNGQPAMIGDPASANAPWMGSEHHLLDKRSAPFANEETSRSSLSLAIFASTPASQKNAPPRTKSKRGPKSFNSRESHGSIFAYPRSSHIRIPDEDSKDLLSSLPSPPPVYGGSSRQSKGDTSPRYISLPPSSRHSTNSHSPTTPRSQTFLTMPSTERELPQAPSVPQSPREYLPVPTITDSAPHYSMNFGPSPVTTRPPSRTPSISSSIAPTVFNRRSTATQASMDARKSKGVVSLRYNNNDDDDASSVYTTIDRMASFRSMPRISTGPDFSFSADWNELGFSIPPVPDLPSRSNTTKSSRVPSLHPSQEPVPSIPHQHAGQELATGSNSNPFQDPPRNDGLASVDETTVSREEYTPSGRDLRTSTLRHA